MSITEEQRHRLFQRLEEVLGEEAPVLMELLPPLGWADVARRHDFDRLDQRLGAIELRIQHVELRMDNFDQRMDAFGERLSTSLEALHRDMRIQLYWLIGVLASMAALVVSAIALG